MAKVSLLGLVLLGGARVLATLGLGVLLRINRGGAPALHAIEEQAP